MVTTNYVFKSLYRDSVVLMRLARELEQLEGVTGATVVMGTDNNKELLRQAELLTDEGKAASPNDLLIGLQTDSKSLAEDTLAFLQDKLSAKGRGLEEGGDYRPRTLNGALQAMPQANLALISLPGAYAGVEARKALERGLHVLLFSDNVSLEDEVNLKRLAANNGLFMLGPDCGTAIINGVPLGFANAVPRGRVGLASASGTGLQHVTCLLAEAGEGVSQALGVGGRDLSDSVDGTMTLQALEALQRDPETEVIVVISKPPGSSARNRLVEALGGSAKPCVMALLGDTGEHPPSNNLYFEPTLEGAAWRTLALLGRKAPPWSSISDKTRERLILAEARLGAGPRRIRGLYSGGTLCYEALYLLDQLGEPASFNPDPYPQVGSPDRDGHILLDLGDDRYTVGRPHPMIDMRPRCEHIVREGGDPNVGILLLDVVLGHGAHPDPASELAPAIEEAQRLANRAGRGLATVIALCGTRDDPQRLEQQEAALNEAGAIVVHSNALAARTAVALSRGDLGPVLED